MASIARSPGCPVQVKSERRRGKQRGRIGNASAAAIEPHLHRKNRVLVFLWIKPANGWGMAVRLLIFAIAAVLLAEPGADAACPPGKAGSKTPAITAAKTTKPKTASWQVKSPDCVVDFNAAPEISRQVVLQERMTVNPAPIPAIDDPDKTAPYTGPTVGVSSVMRRAPEIGYRWALE
jgi:hypothetical protein